jgi:isoleucyl-tRNA synthetase
LRHILLDQANIKSLEVISPKEEEKLKEVQILPNLSVIGPVFRDKSKAVLEAINSMDKNRAFNLIKEGKPIIIKIDNEEIELKPEYFTIKHILPENFKEGKFSLGMIYLDITKYDELLAEGLIRDVIRRIQEMRKRLDLKVDAYIKAWIGVTSEKTLTIIKERINDIANEVRAKEIDVHIGEIPSGQLKEVWEIDGEEITISIEEMKT